MERALPLFALALMPLTACTLKPHLEGNVRVVLDDSKPIDFMSDLAIPMATVITAPSNLANMACYALNVTGPGIVQQITSSSADPVPWNCVNLGVTSKTVDYSTAHTKGISLTIPSGPLRNFQILGLVTPGAAGSCAGQDVVGLIKGTLPNLLYTMGQVQQPDLYQSGPVIQIPSSYDPAAEILQNCFLSSTSPQFAPLYFDGGINSSLAASTVTGSLPLAGENREFTTGRAGPGPRQYPFFSDKGITTNVGQKVRMDILVDASTIPLAYYQSLQITVSLSFTSSGTGTPNAGGCNVTTSSTSADVGIWDPASGTWLIQTLLSPATDAIFAPDPTVYSPTRFITNESGGGGSGQYIHIGIVGANAVPASGCAQIQVGQVSLNFIR